MGACIVEVDSGGTEDSDELLTLLKAREAKQKEEADKLGYKVHSPELRRATLSSIRQTFEKNAQSQADGRATGA